jgi:hypothetical protein
MAEADSSGGLLLEHEQEEEDGAPRARDGSETKREGETSWPLRPAGPDQ